MPHSSHPTIVRDADMLAEDFVPSDVPGRDAQLNALRSCLSPAAKRLRPFHVWLFGKTGTGKTLAARHVLSTLGSQAGVGGVYVNCWEYSTLYAVAEKIVRDLRLLRAERSASIVKLGVLMRHLGKKPFILVLDEIDKPSPKERHSILYNLLMLPNVGLICICDSRSHLVGLEDRVRTRLNPRLIEFKPYSREDLAFILEQRAEPALLPDAWDPELLKVIAERAEGNARVAIQTVRNAATLAESSGQKRIAAEHVDRVQNSVRELEKVYALRNLTEHHRLLYEIIKERPGIMSGELWRTYLMRCEERKTKPIAARTFSPYLNRLASHGLVRADRVAEWTKARQFSAVG